MFAIGYVVVPAPVVFRRHRSRRGRLGSGAPGCSSASSSTGPVAPAIPLVPAATLEGPITVGMHRRSPGSAWPLGPAPVTLKSQRSRWYGDPLQGSGCAHARTVVGNSSRMAPRRTRRGSSCDAGSSEKFSGVVAVEWLYVSAGELATDWSFLERRRGFPDGRRVGRSLRAGAGCRGRQNRCPQHAGRRAEQCCRASGASTNRSEPGPRSEEPHALRFAPPSRDAYCSTFSQVGAALRRTSGQKVFNGPTSSESSRSANPSRPLTSRRTERRRTFGARLRRLLHPQPFRSCADFDGSPGDLNSSVGYRIRTDLDVPVRVRDQGRRHAGITPMPGSPTPQTSGYGRSLAPPTPTPTSQATIRGSARHRSTTVPNTGSYRTRSPTWSTGSRTAPPRTRSDRVERHNVLHHSTGMPSEASERRTSTTGRHAQRHRESGGPSGCRPRLHHTVQQHDAARAVPDEAGVPDRVQ